jgi:hypothetical protein
MGPGGNTTPRRPAIEVVAAQLRGSWAADTAWIDDWTSQNPARGQCGSSALVVQDLCGGELFRGLVDQSDDDLTVHYWNALEVGQLDVTWAQFPYGARIVLGERVGRQDLLTTPWLERRYETLLARVQCAGDLRSEAALSTAVSQPRLIWRRSLPGMRSAGSG